jgi:hypothetical protein
MILPLLFLLLFVNSCSGVNTYPIITIEPYLVFTGKSSEMRVMWHLLETVEATIQWGTDDTYSLGSAETSEVDVDHTHVYTISNLTPGMKYYYRVIFNDLAYEGSFFTSPPGNETNLKFFTYGDTRSHPEVHETLSGAMVSLYKSDPSYQTFVLHAGDIVDEGDEVSSWASDLFNPGTGAIREMMMGIPLLACMGNHEDSGVLFEKYFTYPYKDERYYSFDYGPVHVTVIDQYVDYSPGSAQYQWIVDDLGSTDRPWKFLLMHEPGWSAGYHPNNEDVQTYLHPLCRQFGVDIVFAGHNHYYARAAVEGIQYVTTGGGGAPLKTPGASASGIVAVAKRHHFCKIDIQDNVLSFEAVTAEGDLLDGFTLIH